MTDKNQKQPRPAPQQDKGHRQLNDVDISINSNRPPVRDTTVTNTLPPPKPPGGGGKDESGSQ